jgi:hypothetical protein
MIGCKKKDIEGKNCKDCRMFMKTCDGVFEEE